MSPTSSNVLSLMPRFGRSVADEAVDLAEQQRQERKMRRENAPKNGPTKLTWRSAGQMRRLAKRIKDSQARKANRTYRKRWMANQQAIATLRGHLIVAGALPSAAGTLFGWDAQHASEIWLLDRFEGIDTARDHFYEATGIKPGQEPWTPEAVRARLGIQRGWAKDAMFDNAATV